MGLPYYRGEKCKECNSPVPVFALGHFKPKGEGEDEFSKKCMGFYLYGYSKSYFLDRLVEIYHLRNDIPFDMVCLCPTSMQSEFNEHMKELTNEMAKKLNIPYKPILKRIRETSKQHELKTKEERIGNVKGSMAISDEYAGALAGKNIIVVDNLSTSGATVQEIHKLIIHENKANSCIFLCLGLGSKAKDADFDINPNFKGKFSTIIHDWHWPKVPAEERIKKK